MRRTNVMTVAMAFLLVAGTASAQDDGFVGLLNAARAQRGLPAVQHDAAAVPVAVANNAAQLVYGLGHHVTGGLGQVAAIGIADARSALAAWTQSPAHAAILYAPDLISVGYSQLGGAATAATSQSFGAAGYQQPSYGAAPQNWAPSQHWVPAQQYRGWRLFRR